MKRYLDIVITLLITPLLLVYWLMSLVIDREPLFRAWSQGLSLLPGKLGSYIRKNFFYFVMDNCHRNCVIGFGVLFSHPDTDIASGVYIGPQSNVGKCSIGDNTLLGSGVHIVSGGRQHGIDDIDTPIQQQQGYYQKVDVGEDCWIGNGAIVMADVGRKAVVAAGSVVVNDVPPCAIVAGNPAAVIKYRKGSKPPLAGC